MVAATLGVLSTVLTTMGIRLWRRHSKKRIIKKEQQERDVDSMSVTSGESCTSVVTGEISYEEAAKHADVLY